VPFLVMLVVLAAAGAMLMRHPRLSDA